VVAPEVVDVAEIASVVAHGQLPSLGSTVPEVTVEGSTTKAWADPSRVSQILRNLLVNAGKYGGDRVWVVVGSTGSGVSVAVCDNGDGVRPESERAIFEAFQRAHDIPTQPASLGLGLAISRRLARLMGGDIEYRRVPDRTEFVLSLPEPAA
jgi:signal transduction histidine kinase